MEDFFANYGTWILFGVMTLLMAFMHLGHGHAGHRGMGQGEKQEGDHPKDQADAKASVNGPEQRPPTGSCH